MKKKHNDFFKLLQLDSGLQSDKCKKAISQLRSYKEQIDRDWAYADKKNYKNMTKKLLFLQQNVSSPELVKALRCMQGEYHKKFNHQDAQQRDDFRSGASDSWCGVEYEY